MLLNLKMSKQVPFKSNSGNKPKQVRKLKREKVADCDTQFDRNFQTQRK